MKHPQEYLEDIRLATSELDEIEEDLNQLLDVVAYHDRDMLVQNGFRMGYNMSFITNELERIDSAVQHALQYYRKEVKKGEYDGVFTLIANQRCRMDAIMSRLALKVRES